MMKVAKASRDGATYRSPIYYIAHKVAVFTELAARAASMSCGDVLIG